MLSLRNRKLTYAPFLKSMFRPGRFLITSPQPDPTAYPEDEHTTTANYDYHVNLAGNSNDFQGLRTLLNKRVKDGCFNTTNTFRFVTQSAPLLDELTRTLSELDPGFTRKSAFDSLVARLSKVGRIDDALRVAGVMVSEKYGANAVTYHPILSRLTKRKKISEAQRVMDVMRLNGIAPDLTAYNNILTAYSFNGDVVSAAKVMEEMNTLGLGADTRTYDALVLGACKVGRLEGALAIIRYMVGMRVSPLYCTYTNVIGGLVKCGHIQQAIEFVMVNGGKDEKLDTECFGFLASRLMNLNKVEDAMFLLEEMAKRGLGMGGKLRDFYHLNGGKVSIFKEYKCS